MWADEAADAYKRFKGIELMPWQRFALEAQLAQVDGRLVHRTALTTLPRQQGKTIAMGALILWWTTIHAERTGRPENVILVGHMLKTLEQVIMRDLGNRMVEQFDAKFFRSSGRMEIELPNGSRIWAIAANDSAGHGLSASLVVADELWDIDAEVVDQAIMPTQSAQPMPLFSAWSTAGTEASTLMLRYRQLGLDAIDKGEQTRNLFLEWSAPPSADLRDPAVWAACNPAWGHTVNAEEVEAEARLDWQSFLRKRLNLWVSAQNSWLEPGTWEELVTTEEPSGPMKVLAVDSSPDGSRIVGVRVWPLEGDRVLVAPAFTVTSEREAWVQIRALLEPATILAITPGLNGHTPPELAARTTQVGYGELSQWTSPVINRIMHGAVAHHGAQLLTDHISRAVAVTTKDGLVLSTQKSPGPIELARCAVWAIYLATKPVRQSRPAIGKATARPRNWVL